MRRHVRAVFGLLLPLALALVAACGPRALAGEDDDLIDDVGSSSGANEVMVIRNVRNIEANIDAWVYGNRGNRGASQQNLETQLDMKVEDIARSAGMSEAQRQKLRLAGLGDIRHFADRVDEIKVKHQSTEFSQQQWRAIFEEIRPLQAEVRRGLFGTDSLFDKTLRKLLSPEQAARRERADHDRQQFQHRALVEMTAVRLSRALGLRSEQRVRLVRLLLEKTQPQLTPGEHDQMLVLAQMTRIPEEDLKPLFDEKQWERLQQVLNRVSAILPAHKELPQGVKRRILEKAPSPKNWVPAPGRMIEGF
jgi:hypothetical protein